MVRTFLFTTVTQLAFTPEEDCTLVGAVSNTSAIVAGDPMLTLNDLNNPTIDGEVDSVLVAINIGSPIQFAVPLRKGETVFISVAGAGAFVIFYLV